MANTAITRKTLREQVAEVLRKRILNGEIQPGERMIEAQIAGELQISRGPIREALRQLEEEGLIEYKSHKGCIVKTMTYEEMQEAYLIRSTLEALAVKMCSGKLTEELDEKMEKNVLEMGRAADEKDLYRVIELDEQFHSYVVMASHSKKLYKVWKSLESGNTSAYYTMGSEALVPFDYIQYNHQRILDAFRMQSVEQICEEIQQHYMIVPEVLFQELQKKKQSEKS
nr:GntR family transcriptional regulator [uncultured Sellimonas sp.]